MPGGGLTTFQFVDHFGMTVPDLDNAIRFFEKALDARLIWRVGPFHETPTGANVQAVEIAMLRLSPNLNLELLQYRSNEQRQLMPSNIDAGAGHLAFFVDDLHAAAEALTQQGAEFFPGPVEGTGEAKKGEVLRYFRTPWGAFMEILWRPGRLPYEELTEHRLFVLKERTGDDPPREKRDPRPRYVDHAGMVVPDLDQAVRFCEEALGAQMLWRLGPFTKTPTGVPIRTVHVAMLRLGPNLNLELQAIAADQQRQEIPSNIDLGACHIAFHVGDLHAAAASLSAHGASMLQGPHETKGEAKSGERIWYFKTPWGALMELVCRPDHLPYESSTESRLFRPTTST